MKLCACEVCGLEVSKEGNKFIRGHTWRNKVGPSKGRKFGPPSEETRRRNSESMIGKNKDKKKPPRTKEHCENLSKALKESWKDPNNKLNSEETRRSMSESKKRNFKDPEFLKNYTKYMSTKPNKPENFITEILKELHLEKFEYVGDYKVWINGKNPDWINEENKKIIEYFGSYWHDKEMTGKSREDHEQERTNHFKKEGYSTLVL